MRIIPRVAALLLAATCAAGAVTAAPGPASAAPSAPLGGPHMGTTGTLRSPGSAPLPTGLKAHSFILADLTTGVVYAARRPHQKLAPASTLKTLTALTLIRNVSPSRGVKMTSKVRRVECSCVGLYDNRTYVMDDLLHAILMRSGNDAAELAAMAPGSRAETLELMNSLAWNLQANDTRAMTPSGLPALRQTSSAYDLALINRAAFADPRFRRVIGARTHMFGPVRAQTKKLVTQNELYHMKYPGQLGSKNGWTRASKQTFVAVAKRGNRTLLVTLMYNEKGIAKEAAKLLDWGFALGPDPRPLGVLVEPKTPLKVPAS
jgi:D-alanyl-D-alanine carboxypeptidase (penicillin-binding protein 5/6)